MDKTVILNTKNLIQAIRKDLEYKKLDPKVHSLVCMSAGYFAADLIKHRPIVACFNKDIKETMETLNAISEDFPKFAENHLLTANFFASYSSTLNRTYKEALMLMDRNLSKDDVDSAMNYLDVLYPLYEYVKCSLKFTESDLTELKIRAKNYQQHNIVQVA
tara:strand:+ start:218 stop:700 length:483 start_codon:yes stop_codon:yes gene_type:complete